ncbi:hypothetical protein BDN71DRAFT_409538 [Pleurotus eryngii]|uniref:Uncharacterized protein n=1 Tax=Pleurotus eryngii TaxID=5323 RepID=A0A9P5ZK73_PLEER|nr:hypothetical protein BDN71DRAFT_409538 [Pleurotus eryngii]
MRSGGVEREILLLLVIICVPGFHSGRIDRIAYRDMHTWVKEVPRSSGLRCGGSRENSHGMSYLYRKEEDQPGRRLRPGAHGLGRVNRRSKQVCCEDVDVLSWRVNDAPASGSSTARAYTPRYAHSSCEDPPAGHALNRTPGTSASAYQ